VAGQSAVFVDRDDTLNKDCPYCSKPEQIVLLPTVGEGVRLLNEAGLPVFVVTNQSGIGRGFFTEQDLAAIHAKMQADLAALGARIDRFYHCPHPPERGCQDRKPNTGLLLRAAVEHGLDLERCAVIGDRVLDMELARRARCLAVMVPSERGRAELAWLGQMPDFVAPTFAAAAAWVAERLAAKPG
jgi:histidinol-phosphate phosphatase family protein